MHFKMLFSFFESDHHSMVVSHEPVRLAYEVLKSTSHAIAALPPIKNVVYFDLIHKQQVKSKQIYLKQHAKAFNTRKLKGCRIRR